MAYVLYDSDSVIYSFIIMSLIHLLEDKHHGSLNREKVLHLAQTDKNFAHQWFVHLFRCEATQDEIILASAYCFHWKIYNLATLSQLIGEDMSSNKGGSTNSVKLDTLTSALPDVDEIEFIDFVSFVLTLLSRSPEQKEQYEVAKVFDSKLSNALFEKIVKQVEPELKDVTLFGQQGAGSQDHSIRNNSQFFTPLPNLSIELAMLERVTANALGCSIQFAEPPVILRYQPGQYYHWHYDYIHPHNSQIETQISQFGQRIKTAILNLNDDFTGGETEFKQPSISLKPQSGQIITFDNADEQGNRIVKSIHRGKEVTEGKKWIMTLWFRDKPYWLRSPLLS